MPNYCSNYLKIEGTENAVKELLQLVNLTKAFSILRKLSLCLTTSIEVLWDRRKRKSTAKITGTIGLVTIGEQNGTVLALL